MKIIKNNGIQMVMEFQMQKIQMETEKQINLKTQQPLKEASGKMLKTVEKETEKIQQEMVK